MNFTKLIESMEIFRKYSAPEKETSRVSECPLDLDYYSMSVHFNNTLIDAADVARLTELGWTVRKNPVWGSRAYTVAEDEVGRYEIFLDLRSAFQDEKKADAAAAKAAEEAAQAADN